MNFLQLKDISERYMELVNPSSPEKVMTAGRVAGLKEGSRVIDFACGFGEALALWATGFGIEGEGIEVREKACARARRKMAERGMQDRVKIVCADAATYAFEESAFDLAVCMGASFVWGGFQPTLATLKRAIRPGGCLLVGEPYWLTSDVPSEYRAAEPSVHFEHELLSMARSEGLDLEYVVRASHDDWDRYLSQDWYGLVRWIEENPGDPLLGEVMAHLRDTQDDYFKYGREYMDWAMYLLRPLAGTLARSEH